MTHIPNRTTKDRIVAALATITDGSHWNAEYHGIEYTWDVNPDTSAAVWQSLQEAGLVEGSMSENPVWSLRIPAADVDGLERLAAKKERAQTITKPIALLNELTGTTWTHGEFEDRYRCNVPRNPDHVHAKLEEAGLAEKGYFSEGKPWVLHLTAEDIAKLEEHLTPNYFTKPRANGLPASHEYPELDTGYKNTMYLNASGYVGAGSSAGISEEEAHEYGGGTRYTDSFSQTSSYIDRAQILNHNKGKSREPGE